MNLDFLSLSRATNNAETDAPFLFYWKLIYSDSNENAAS